MKFRRRKFITNAGLQMKVTLLFVIISLLGSIVSAVLFNFYALKKFDALMWSTHINVKDTGEIIRPLFIYVNVGNFLFVSIMLVIAVIWMMRIKSGPIFRMTRDIMKITEGDLSTNITLRKKDEFQYVAVDLNDMAKKVRERFAVIIDKYAGISKSVEALRENNGAAGDHENACDLILNNIEDIEMEIKKFSV